MTDVIFTDGKVEVKTDNQCIVSYSDERVEVKIGTEVPIEKQ